MTVIQYEQSLAELMALGRGAALPSAPHGPVHEAVAAVAAAKPDHIAVYGGDSALDYAALITWSDRLAARLAAAGVRRGDRVGLLAEPSSGMVAAALGILRAGSAYVPLDQAHPDQRIAEVLADARVACVMVTKALAGRVSGLGRPVIALDDGGGGGPDVALANAARANAARAAAAGPALPAVGEADPAYLIYTSGSTGEPKGVLVEHGQLAASTLARRQVYPGAPVFLLVSPLAFDSSVAGLWGTLTAGGTVVVAAPHEVRDPSLLVGLVERRRVTTLLCIPSLYSVVLDAAQRLGLELLATLDTVIVAGEPLSERLLERHFAVHRLGVALINEYGPTEATVWASYRRYDEPGPLSIGGPIPGAHLYVLDDNLGPVARGVEGELYVSGPGVARGYFGRPEETARVFLDDPFIGGGARMYRTGDHVRWNAEGTLDFLGRADEQVKIRGHRIELSAVEAALRGAEGVREAAVLPNRDRTRLTGFVIAVPGTTPEAIRRHAAGRLAPAAIPARIEILDSFPVTFSGKVDRARLRDAADAEAAPPAAAACAGTTAKQVSAAWSQVLRIGEIPPDANFFELGGDSLGMFQLQDALERHTGTRPSVVALFRHTTVTAQAELINRGGSAAAGPRRVTRPRPVRRAAGRIAGQNVS